MVFLRSFWLGYWLSVHVSLFLKWVKVKLVLICHKVKLSKSLYDFFTLKISAMIRHTHLKYPMLIFGISR